MARQIKGGAVSDTADTSGAVAQAVELSFISGGTVAALADTSGNLGLKSLGYTAKQTVTRPNDSNGYTANDVLGPSAGTSALTFAAIGPTGGGEVMLTSATFERDVAALIAGEAAYTLHLYNVTPPSALADNAAFDVPSGDRSSYLGSINLGTPVDLGSTLYVAVDALNKQVTVPSGGSLFGYLVTVGAYTPVAQTVLIVALHATGL